MIYPGVTINSDVRIGENVIISSGATIDHEAVIEDNVLISTGVTIARIYENNEWCPSRPWV